jgi:3-hydroxyisobutyrate dehydrogenase
MPETAKPRVAVIGLGSMGYGMATSLRRAGLDVTGCDVSSESVERFVADGGKGASTPAEAAKSATSSSTWSSTPPRPGHSVWPQWRCRALGQGGVRLVSHHGSDVARRLAKQPKQPGGIIWRRSRAARSGAGRTHHPGAGNPAALPKPDRRWMRGAKALRAGDDAGQARRSR